MLKGAQLFYYGDGKFQKTRILASGWGNRKDKNTQCKMRENVTVGTVQGYTKDGLEWSELILTTFDI